MHIFLSLLLISAVACKTTEESQTSGIATQADIAATYRIVGGQRSLGKCQTVMSLSEEGNYRLLNYKFEAKGAELAPSSFEFSNHESNRSRVDVSYSAFGFGSAVQIVLEKVDITTSIPAKKYRFTYTIENDKPTQLEVRVMVGYESNAIQKIQCI